MPWSNYEGPALGLVISGRVLRETGQFHCLGFLRQWLVGCVEA